MNARAQIDCEEALRRLAGFLDRELGQQSAVEVERHLETCRSCYSRAEFERRLRERLREDLKETAVPPGLERRVRRLLDELAGS